MAPKAKQSGDSMKQKSLNSWFSKPSEQKPTQKPSRPSKPVASKAGPSKVVAEPRTSEPKTPETRAMASPTAGSSPSSYGRGSVKDTPPTSDCIDVDMLFDDEEVKVKVKPMNGKRKIVYEDSDDDDMQVSGASSVSKGTSVPQSSSPAERIGRAKKRRLSLPNSDEEEDEEVASSFTKRLTHFKKSPVKKARRSKASDDEDDFIAPSDDSDVDVDVKSTNASSSRASSRMSMLSDEDEDEDEVVVKKSKPKAKPQKSTTLAGPASAGFSLLTAAERREQEKKNDKKSAEDPYAFLLDIKDKDGRRPNDPKYDPRTLYIPSAAWKTFTPFEKQFWEIKQNHYDTILFFQKGKFFELYEDDARVGHQEFDLKLTARVKMCMVGVPEMSFNFWAAKFLGKGYKVGRVDQAETALGAEMRQKGKGKEKDKIVRRELHKVYTNGTLVDGEMLTDDEAGHCISIREEESADGSSNVFGICVLDCATSQFNLSIFEDDICRTKLETLMRQVRPKELLFTKGKLSVSTTRLLKSILPPSCLWTALREVEGFDYEQTLEELKNLYPGEKEGAMEGENVLSLTVPAPIREMVDSKHAIEALGLLIWYLRQLNIDKDILSMKNFNIYDPMKRGQGLVLDGQTLAHIEVLLNDEGTVDGTLLQLLGRCITPSGKRLFRIWLCMPLKEISDINARLDAVQDLMDHPTFENDFTKVAKGLPDLERIVSRIHAKNCKVKDFLKVLQAFERLSKGLNALADTSETFKSKTILGLLRSAPDLLPHINNIESRFEKPKKGGDDEMSGKEKDPSELLPRRGKDKVYDDIMDTIDGLEDELDGELKKFRKKLGIDMNWWHSSLGNKDIYLVEVKASEKDLPMDWKKDGGTKAKSRYVVPSLQKSIRALKEARESQAQAIKSFRFRLFDEFDADRSVWLRAVRVLAELDCLFSLAKSSQAMGEPKCRPEFVEDDTAWIDFVKLRHPTLAMRTSVEEFIPNDVKLGGDVGRIALLTGPNMAGKSTVMRMTATGVIMAQLGMFVPASSARLSPVDSVLTRMGAYDNMFSNSSTFKVELDECCKILRDATPKSLVILDELGRGTSTYDGMAIAGAVLHQLATHTLPLSFFATHYGALTDDFAYHPNIRNMHMKTMVDEERREIVFLYKLVEGVATGSFGTHVANLAGVPIEVVERADLISKNFAEQFKEKLKLKQKESASARLPIVMQADFAYLCKLAMEEIALSDDVVRQRLALKVLRETAKKWVGVKA